MDWEWSKKSTHSHLFGLFCVLCVIFDSHVEHNAVLIVFTFFILINAETLSALDTRRIDEFTRFSTLTCTVCDHLI